MTLSILLRLLALVQAGLERCAESLRRDAQESADRAYSLLDRAEQQREDSARAERVAIRISDLTA